MNVANGPNRSDRKNQFKPVLFFPWASAALINANVPQPTKYSFPIFFTPYLFRFTRIPQQYSLSISIQNQNVLLFQTRIGALGCIHIKWAFKL